MAWPHQEIGIYLRLTTGAEGGRSQGLGPFGNAVLEYRPNWGFRGLDHPYEQAGAPVLVWERDRVEPGDHLRAVIIPMAPEVWADVRDGDDLVMYEGNHVCGRATVVWRSETSTWPVDDNDVRRCRAWVETGHLAS